MDVGTPGATGTGDAGTPGATGTADARATGALTIAIDGPAASGKSTIGRALAEALGLLYLDTGAMYRAATWLALRRGIDPADEAAVTGLARAAQFDFPDLEATDRVNPPIAIDGLDATAGIRGPEVDAAVSAVSSYPGVREALVARQREIARSRGVVMVGRDIGTVVLPGAALKLYLEASAQERARRRYEERTRMGKPADFDEIRLGMERRDRLDSERAHSPLRPAADAVILDTTGLDTAQVVERALRLAHERAGAAAP